jgi:predicted short-subunit dehydrogenase-like oxidoreductase (DUF2520 family)
MDRPTYGLVGRGRAATHLRHYLELERQRVQQWHRGLAEASSVTLESATVILLAISDDALEGFVAAHPGLGHRPLVHFSGSLTLGGMIGLHPLMTFGPEPYDLETYRAIPFIEEQGATSFRDIFPALDNPVFALDSDLKPLYHALCVLAGNFTTVLWAKAFEEFESTLGLPREVLRPFLERTVANTLDAGSAALTGSLARGDRGTVARDLAALDGDPYAEIYRAIARVFETEEVRA